ncbi:hypothetical protein QFC22_003259 [Naganishia vaughanmartiniae]|uniref:Uncharacterized protein n=1 Tax=Naganishia vaughanmartiniae TaxID=1424756 RepID=A0ACC2X829_9TREE|nr:hypothetical protein QFC22_003259 [Naganishia vaughanmartiniae]
MANSTLHHSATFTWPPTASDRVVVTGTFDNWSGNTHVLTRDPKTGYFSATVPIKYGDKVAYKYVVDGQWMTREDEAKEWDSAGNMNNVYTAPHAPKPSEPLSPASASSVVPSAQPAQAVPQTSTQTASRQSLDRDSTSVASAPTSAQIPSSTTNANVAQDTTSETTTTDKSDKKHGLAALAAGAASAIGIKKASHGHDQSKDTSIRSTSDDVSRAPASAHTPAVAAESATRSNIASSNETSVPASSSPLTSTNAQVTSKHVTNDVPAATAHASHSTTTTSTSLAGLSLGAPIGGAAVSQFDSPAHTTTTYGTAANTTSASALAEEQRKSIVPTSTTGLNESVKKHDIAGIEKSEETAVAPKTEGPKTSIPQPAVVVPGSTTDKTSTSSIVPSASDYPDTFGKSLATSDETAVAPKDIGPKTSIPQPDVSGAGVSSASTRTPVSANIPTTNGDKAGVDLNNKTGGLDFEHTLAETVENVAQTAQQVGTSAFAAVSAAASGLLVGVGDAVHAVTGVDVLHRDPVSLVPAHDDREAGARAGEELSELEEGKRDRGLLSVADRRGSGSGDDKVAGVPSLMMTMPRSGSPFESGLKRSPRLAQTGFQLPAPSPPPALSSSSASRPVVRRAPSSSSGSLYKLGDQELRRRSWNLHNNDQHLSSPQISVEEAKAAGIPTRDLPNLGAGQPSTVSAGNLANSLTSVVPVAQNSAAQISSTAKDTANQLSSSAKDTASQFNSSARNLTSTSGFSNQGSAAPVVPAKSTTPIVSSYTDIPLPPSKDGLPAPVDDADIKAVKSVPQSSISSTGLHPTAPRISAPVHGSMAGSASPTSGSAVNSDNTNAATASSPSAPKQPDVFSSNQHDKPAIPAGEKRAEYKTDLPAQHETKNTNHKSVPMPVITSIGDNTKDRTQPSLADNAAKEVSSDPAVDPHQAKAEAHAGLNNDIDGVPSRSYAKKSPVDENAAVTGLPLATTQKPINELPAVPVAAAPVAAAPATPVKPAVAAVPVSAPQTPASRLAATSEVQASPASIGSSTGGTGDKKKKGSFISKMKNVFHKDKTAK